MISVFRIARLPPVIFFVCLLGALQAHRLRPVYLGSESLAVSLPLGGALLLASIALFLWGFREMKRRGTTEEPEGAPTALVTSGAFAISRNPLYIALITVLAALSIFVDSAWILLSCLPFWAALNFVVVPREEEILARSFPEEYSAYRKRVRRWL